MNGLEKQIINLLSGDLGASFNPYAELAARLGLAEETVLEIIRNFRERGLIRRLGVTLRHQKSGYKANALLVFQAPPERAAEYGQKLAGLAYISHCYQRRTVPGWSFNVYAMIHAEDETQLQQRIGEATALCPAGEWRVLKSIKELKKDSLRYFPEAPGLDPAAVAAETENRADWRY